MKTTLIIFAMFVIGCEPQITLSIPCVLPQGQCAMSDAEFSRMFSDMGDDEQTAYVALWSAPELPSGFVSIARIYDLYEPTMVPPPVYWTQ